MLLRLTPILLVSWRPTTCQWEIWHLIIPHQTIPFMNGRRLLKVLGASITSALIAASGLLPINTHAAAQRIAWVSFHPADNTPSGAAAAAGFTQAPDVEYTRLLAAAGHTVTRIVTSASPDTTLLNGFDLVIISRSVPSSHYQTDPSPGLWNGITKPTIILGGYILRASRLGYTIGDTMVDTGGEIRLSNFLLWQAAYAELVFLSCYWPDFGKAHLVEAIQTFAARERRFGGVPAAGVAS